MSNRTSMTISGERKMKLERLALDATKKIDKTILWTNIVNYMIDEYSKDAVEDMKSKIKNEKEAK